MERRHHLRRAKHDWFPKATLEVPDTSNLAIQAGQEVIWVERPRQSQVDLALDNWCLTAEKNKKRNMSQLRKIMFWRKEELSCFAFLALYVKGHARFKVMIPMMVLFRFQGLSGWQLWFSCALPFGDLLAMGPITSSSLLLYFAVHSFKRNLLLCLWSSISLSRTVARTRRKTAHDSWNI